jgi:hypothetical protein
VVNAQVHLGLLVEARDTFGRVTRSPQPADESLPLRRAREACGHLYVELESRIPSVRFDVRGAKGDVAILVDDVTVSPAAHKFPFKLNPGRHVIVAKSGTSTARAEVDVAERETKDVVLNIVMPNTPAPSPIAHPEAPVQAPPPGPSTLTYVGFGVAGLGVAVGTITGILMFSNKSSLDEECSTDKQCPRDSSLSTAYTMATISTISFALAAVGAGVGVYGLLTGSRSSTSSARGIQIEPWASVGTGGFRGSF